MTTLKLKYLTILLLSHRRLQFILKEEVYTEYDPNKFLADETGIDALLTGAYAIPYYCL
jgi:hypothetical protein